MKINDSLEQEIKQLLEVIKTQTFEDQIQTVKNLVDKYSHLNKSSHLMNYYDLISIINTSKGKAGTETMPKFLDSGSTITKVTSEQQILSFVVEATIGHLNKLDCFKRLPKFDYKEDKWKHLLPLKV